MLEMMMVMMIIIITITIITVAMMVLHGFRILHIIVVVTAAAAAAAAVAASQATIPPTHPITTPLLPVTALLQLLPLASRCRNAAPLACRQVDGLPQAAHRNVTERRLCMTIPSPGDAVGSVALAAEQPRGVTAHA
jgi:hypothetical protein